MKKRCVHKISKKAEFSVLLTLIAVALGALLLFSIIYGLIMKSDRASDIQKCKLSIFAADKAARVKEASAGIADLIPDIKCKAETIKIDSNYASVSRGGRIDDDILKSKLAKEFYNCWDMIGYGKQMPLKNSFFESYPTACLKCARIEFTEDFREQAKKQDYTLSGLYYWLSTRRVPGQENSFYEIVYGRQPSINELEVLKQYPEKWDLTKDYELIWRFQPSSNFYYGIVFGPSGNFQELYEKKYAGYKNQKITSVQLLDHLTGKIPSGSTIIGFVSGQQYDSDVILQSIHIFPFEELSETMIIPGTDEPIDICTIPLN